MLRTVKYLVFDFLRNFIIYSSVLIILTYIFDFIFFKIFGGQPNCFFKTNVNYWNFVHLSFMITVFILLFKVYHILRKDKENGIYKANKSILVKGDVNLVYYEIKDFIKSKHYFLIKEDDDSKTLKYFTNFTMFSFGYVTKLEIIKADDGTVVIEASSKSLIPTTLFDFGRNMKNIKRLETYLYSL